MSMIRRLCGLLTVAAVLTLSPDAGLGQSLQSLRSHEPGSGSLVSESENAPPRILEKRYSETVGLADDGAGDAGHSKFRTRQAVILSGLAVSVVAYGYFTLQFNNRRSDAESARLAYQADVRENAQDYVDQGVQLDDIPTYHDWEDAYNDAYSTREMLAIAGFASFLLAAGAILDSATAGKQVRENAVSPIIGVSPASGEVMMGARVGF